MTGREFFSVTTVAEALAGFRPARRTGAETVGLGAALRASAGTTPPSDLNGAADYRLPLAGVLTGRAVLKAAGA